MVFYTNSTFIEWLAGQPDFWVPEPRTWFLVYGDTQSKPLVVVLVTEEPSGSNSLVPVHLIPEEAAIPVIRLIVPKVGPFQLLTNENETSKEVTDADLRQLFKSYGVPVTTGTTNKVINRQSSSRYHDWQRDSLGASVTVSDVDAISLSGQKALIEIKRSFKEPTGWTPYAADRANYELIFNLSRIMGFRFFTLYHKKEEAVPSSVGIFEMARVNELPQRKSLAPLSQLVEHLST